MRFFGIVCILLMSALLAAPQRSIAQSLRERIQKAREARESADAEKARSPREGTNLRNPGRGQPPARATPTAESVNRWVEYLARLQPKDAAGYNELPLEAVAQGISGVEYWVAQHAQFEAAERPAQVLAVADQLLAAKAAIDRQLENAFEQRARLASIEPEAKRREAIARYLWSSAAYIDLSGRLRYTLFDALNYAADIVAERANDYDRLLDLLLRYKSGVGAAVVSSGLFDPPRNEPGVVAVSLPAKLKIMRLAGESGNYELVPEVARAIKQPGIPPRLLLAGADAIRRLGLPQDERPGQDATLPKPPITAA